MGGDGSSLRRGVRVAAAALLLTGFALPGSLWAQQVEDRAASHADEQDGEAEAAEAAHDEADSDDPAAHVHEEIVVTGSRARERSVTKSMVPIDVISAEHVAHQGETNLDQLLRTVVPSLNISSISGDAATIVRPTNLRGLAPDHTLVLVNGKRRHRGAVILWSRIGVSHGAQGPDLSAIPAIALRQVEVLRDGASAQYGSDAIAGIMNFRLKEARSGGSLEVLTGLYEAGDGESVTVAGNVGLPWGEDRFRESEPRGRRREPDEPRRSASGRGGPGRRGEHPCGRSRAEVGQGRGRRRREVLDQLRPAAGKRRHGAVLWLGEPRRP